MKRWYTADLHIGHKNIIRYCNRPFADVDEMDAVIIERWNHVVAPDDEVYVLGDIVMGNFRVGLEKCRALTGRKFMVPGNHDRNLEQVEKNGVYEAVGFTVLPGIVQVPVLDGEVLACHFPYDGDSQDDDRYTAYRPRDYGDPLLHGHVHERWRTRDRMLNVGVDVWDFTPVSEVAVDRWLGTL